jgi:uncharacterized membrane protein
MMDLNTPNPAESAASSPSGAATESALAPAGFRVGIGSISDVVFGLALSIGSLILVSKTPQNGYELVQGIYYFGFSFLIVILVWLSFRRIVVVLPYETQTTLAANVALLFCVAIEPFLFYVLVTTSTVGDDVSTAFAIDIGAMMLLLSALNYLLLREERSRSLRKLAQKEVDRQGRFILLHIAVGGIFLVSAFPFFWTTTIVGAAFRYGLWYFGLIWTLAVQARWASASRPRRTGENSVFPSSRGRSAETR